MINLKVYDYIISEKEINKIVKSFMNEEEPNMTGKYLGKILDVRFGLSSDDPNCIVLDLTFSFNNGNKVQKVTPIWEPVSKSTPYRSVESKWKELNNLVTLFEKCNIKDVSELKNKPVEVEIKDNILVDWRILTEVL